jgi:DNA-binding transcriptional LysR family regulator
MTNHSIQGKVALIAGGAKNLGGLIARDLADGHWLVGYAASGSGRAMPWEHLDTDGTLRTAALHARVVVDNAESYIACCRAGLGIIQVPRYDVQPMIDRGELVEVLAQARAAPMAVSMLYPHRRQRSQRLTAFVDWFQALIAPHLEPPVRGASAPR